MARRYRRFDEAYEEFETGSYRSTVKCDECGHICDSGSEYCDECGALLISEMDISEIDSMDSDSDLADDEDINAEFELEFEDDPEDEEENEEEEEDDYYVDEDLTDDED